MFGKQGVVPGILEGNPASMQPVVESDSFRREFINRQRSEELYRKLDADDIIQKILAQRSYGYRDQRYSEGEQVLFKEKYKGRWYGPVKVTEMEGSKVRIIHAGYDRTVPACNVIPFREEFEKKEDDEQEKDNKVPGKGLRKRLYGNLGSLEDILPTHLDPEDK